MLNIKKQLPKSLAYTCFSFIALTHITGFAQTTKSDIIEALKSREFLTDTSTCECETDQITVNCTADEIKFSKILFAFQPMPTYYYGAPIPKGHATAMGSYSFIESQPNFEKIFVFSSQDLKADSEFAFQMRQAKDSQDAKELKKLAGSPIIMKTVTSHKFAKNSAFDGSITLMSQNGKVYSKAKAGIEFKMINKNSFEFSQIIKTENYGFKFEERLESTKGSAITRINVQELDIPQIKSHSVTCLARKTSKSTLLQLQNEN